MDQSLPCTSQLRTLRSLPFAEFARCVADLLTRMGYNEVRLAGRTGYRGRNRDGGYDLTATTGKGTSRRFVIVQLKQFKLFKSFASDDHSDDHGDDRVYRRSVDELRGVALRVGAHEAILVTAGVFSSVVRENEAPSSSPSSPSIRLIDGATLCALLGEHGWEHGRLLAGEKQKVPAGLRRKAMTSSVHQNANDSGPNSANFGAANVSALPRISPPSAMPPSRSLPAMPESFPGEDATLSLTVIVRLPAARFPFRRPR